ncbi:MAG: hypothetical protein MUF73_17255 [Rhodobacteraceae bacterium]|jgi:hypothetical protein|nr:hypothetical protein [Paracoccaceae bacterium]
MQAVRLGAIFGAVMFAVGFALGTIRTALLLPRLGEAGAILVELPVMLALSWLVAGWLIRRSPVAVRSTGAALTMGAVAVAVLWALELAMVVWLFGVPLAQAPAAFLTPGSRIGLVAQLLMTIFPALHRLRPP